MERASEALKYFFLVFYYLYREMLLFFLPKSLRFKDISNDIVLITGAGNELGRALALQFIGLASHLVLWDSDAEAVKETDRLVKTLGGRSSYYVLDISNDRMVAECERKVRKDVGPVTIVVNNASFIKGKNFLTLKDEDIVRTFEMNTYSHFWIYKAFLAQMIEANKGHFVIIADAASFICNGEDAAYFSSKAAIAGLFESLALETKDANYDGIEFTFACLSSMKTMPDEKTCRYIARKVIDAMRVNQEIVAIPNSFKLLEKDISNDIALITGAGDGLGRILAVKLSKLVSHLVLLDIDEKGVEQTVEMVKLQGCKCTFYVADVADHESIYKIADRIKAEVGTVTLLINNAGIVNGKNLLDLSETEIKRTFNVNTLSHFWLYKAFVPHMIQSKHGHLVSVASVASYVTGGKLSDYCGSKFAVAGSFEAFSMEMRDHSWLNFTLVCPYWMSTDMFRGASSFIKAVSPEKVADETIKAILTNREMVVVPSYFYFLLLLLTPLSFKVRYDIYRVLDFEKFMNNFVGRRKL
ncbi:epidermal retinol dehydrogenase 2-like protein [Dinothrombium tinctorium]|uniref:Short-chain dehydrogenase/reductase 3 n=1 Tax=Dinothrombium tinctorium TaxID=1965070 RepID=A0A443RRE7_9ACAR|nr:epidermal retinol dehydrogenase 2-like protein [Dinothrombium tinctorium]